MDAPPTTAPASMDAPPTTAPRACASSGTNLATLSTDPSTPTSPSAPPSPFSSAHVRAAMRGGVGAVCSTRAPTTSTTTSTTDSTTGVLPPPVVSGHQRQSRAREIREALRGTQKWNDRGYDASAPGVPRRPPSPYLEATFPVIPMPYLEASSPAIPRRPPSPREAFLEHDADADADEGSPLPYLETTPSSTWPALAGAHALAPMPPPPRLLPDTAPPLLLPVSASASVDGIAHPDIASSWAPPVDASASAALTVALGATPTSRLFTAACSTFTPARAPEHSAVVGAIDETAVDSAAIFEREIGTTLPKKAAAQLVSVWRAEGSGGVDLPVEVYWDYARRFGCAGFGLPLVLMLFGLSQVSAPECA